MVSFLGSFGPYWSTKSLMVEGFEMRVSRFLHRWLRLPRSLSSIALYGHTNKLKLPISSLIGEFMVTQSIELLQYRESSDPKGAQAGIDLRKGCKWRASKAVGVAESRLRQRVLVGTVAQGRAALGSSRTPHYGRAQGKERRALILEEVQAGVEEKRFSQMVGLMQQGSGTRWEQASEHKAVYNVLPSPSKRFTWGKVETPTCTLCQKRGTLEHIFSCCLRALGEGRYRWIHDQFLKAVADAICSGINHSKSLRPVRNTITFIRAGEKPGAASRNTSPGLLATARDWEFKVDLGKQLKIPEVVAKTTSHAA
ncbi:uncharacterized protein LOC121644290 [Melanotaenia boesemani]|uniref:uncharacterized protein LOC121644290 n=1 Tax=Melanotaenia boesemani TaxID=1250792 RepID=UPI001C05A313|nr:uncharacterized protein LOC121644290 [Melanotaenia boesemani]